jgi:AraC-like DNA-binding protein
MWHDILDIHPDCREDFFNFESLPGKGKSFIACAGVSYLQTKYRIGRTGCGEILHDKQQGRVQVHYLIVTKSGGATLHLPSQSNANGPAHGHRYKVAENTIMLLPAGTPFLYELSDEHWDICWLLLHDCPEYKFIGELNPGVWESANAPLIYHTMLLIRDFEHSDSHYQSDILLRLIEVLLYQIEQSLQQRPEQNSQQQRFQSLMRKVNKQLQLPWDVHSLADELHMSSAQFYRLCKKETGKTPMKVLTHSRMEYACYLLRYTNYTLEQIADTVGYADSAGFAHRFKQLFKISPGRWRSDEKTTY